MFFEKQNGKKHKYCFFIPIFCENPDRLLLAFICYGKIRVRFPGMGYSWMQGPGGKKG